MFNHLNERASFAKNLLFGQHNRKKKEGKTRINHQDLSYSSPPFLIFKHMSSDSSSKEEEEVRKMLRECLDLRKKYVYREEVTPSMKVAMANSSASEMKTDPFHFETVEASAVSHSFSSILYVSLSSYKYL